MKKINIVKNNRDFDRIIKNNKPFKYKHFLLYVEKTTEVYQFGISVSKKICNAVWRNKYKRQIKSIIDKNIYYPNFNCIIIARKSILNSSYQELEECLNYCFKKLNLIKGEKYEK